MLVYRIMTEHITIELDEAELARARLAAEAQGVALEAYLRNLIEANLPSEDLRGRQRTFLSKIIGMGSSDEPTEVSRDKDRLLAEAVWKEHAHKTHQE
jgi:hypothetical protein